MKNESCPCSHVASCSESCSCANEILSGGCTRCCSYGSAEQQLNAATLLANIIDSSKIPTYKFALYDDLKDQKEFLPTKAEPLATGWDVRAALEDGKKELVIKPMEYVKISLGFRAFCPPGWWLELRPRSSSFAKKNLHALYGVIDETYEGKMIFAAQYVVPSVTSKIFTNFMGRTSVEHIDHPNLIIKHGEPLGQLIPIKRQSMVIEEVSNDEYEKLCKERSASRGAGGFGSTDKK